MTTETGCDAAQWKCRTSSTDDGRRRNRGRTEGNSSEPAAELSLSRRAFHNSSPTVLFGCVEQSVFQVQRFAEVIISSTLDRFHPEHFNIKPGYKHHLGFRFGLQFGRQGKHLQPLPQSSYQDVCATRQCSHPTQSRPFRPETSSPDVPVHSSQSCVQKLQPPNLQWLLPALDSGKGRLVDSIIDAGLGAPSQQKFETTSQ